MTQTTSRLDMVAGLGGLIAGITSLAVSNLLNVITPNITEPGFEGLPSPQADMAKFLGGFSQNLAPLEEMVTLSVVMLAAIPLFLVLYFRLREISPGLAIIGSVFGVLWAVNVFVFLIMRYTALSTSALLYSTADPGDQAMVVAAATASYYSVYGLFSAGGIFGSIGFFVVGLAMKRTTSFREGYGWMSMGFGILFGLGTADITYALGTDPSGENLFFLVFAILFWVWSIVMGQKLLRLSRSDSH